MDILERYIAPLRRRIMMTVARAVVKTINDSGGIQKMQVGLLADETHSNVDRIQQYGFTSVPLPGAEGIFVSIGGSREHGAIIAIDDKRFRLVGLAPGEVALYTDEGDKIHFKRGNKIEVISAAEVKVQAPEIKLEASTKVTVTSPLVEVNAATKATVISPIVEIQASAKVSALTPLMEVAGVISCAGIGVGVAPVSGEAKIVGNMSVQGDVAATGDVADGVRSMAGDRTIYNGHTHPENGTGGGTTSPPDQPM
jgi:phage baseplate assembly protein V